jgi:hypothetical protein
VRLNGLRRRWCSAAVDWPAVEGEADAPWRANREANAKANDPAFDLHTLARRARRAANFVQRRQDLLRGFLRHTGLPALGGTAEMPELQSQDRWRN